MSSFYREVCRETSLAAALQGAMHEIRKRYPHPHFWAPFLLIGEPGRLSHAEPAQ
jgi:CHAT domain-containing protein